MNDITSNTKGFIRWINSTTYLFQVKVAIEAFSQANQNKHQVNTKSIF